MRFSKVLGRFLLGYLALHLTAVAVFVLIFSSLTRQLMVADAQSRLKSMTSVLAAYLDSLPEGLHSPHLPEVLKRLSVENKVRFTLIGDDGQVAVDSETGTRDIGPHGTRPEILDAKKTGEGFAERFSSTVNQSMMYYAKVYEPSDTTLQPGLIRVAIPTQAMDAAISAIQRLIWWYAALPGVLVALLMAGFAALSMKPLNAFAALARRIGAGEYDQNLQLKHRRDEWGILANAFEQMQDEIATREQTLTENSQRLEAVLSSMIEGVLGLDSDGVVMLANDAACQMLSLAPDELQGHRLLDVVRIPELRAAIEQIKPLRRFSETEFVTLVEPKRRLSARVSALTRESEKGLAIVLHDVTELRRLETMRKDFVANVSHELKTPLASIKAYAETLSLGAIHDQNKNVQFVERIQNQSEQLERQIHDLLEIATVESGQAVFQISDVAVNDACQKCYRQLSVQADTQNLELVLRLTENNPKVRADRDAIETIVKNLVTNAIHYTPAGGTVTIETETVGDLAVIKVIDTGIGIALEDQSRVFERFYRVDKARSREKGGTGLGLSIVKHLAQAFEGSVQLESQVGKGSKFQVRLPLAVES